MSNRKTILLSLIALSFMAMPSLAMKRILEDDCTRNQLSLGDNNDGEIFWKDWKQITPPSSDFHYWPKELIVYLLDRMSWKDKHEFARACKGFFAILRNNESLFGAKEWTKILDKHSDDLLLYQSSSTNPLLLLTRNPVDAIGDLKLLSRRDVFWQNILEKWVKEKEILNMENWSEEKALEILSQNSTSFNEIESGLLMYFTFSIFELIDDLKIQTSKDAFIFLNTCRWIVFHVALKIAQSSAVNVAVGLEEPDDEEENDEGEDEIPYSVQSNIEDIAELSGHWADAKNAINTFFSELGLDEYGNANTHDVIWGVTHGEASRAIESPLIKFLVKNENAEDRTNLFAISAFRLSSIIVLTFLSSNETIKNAFIKDYKDATKNIQVPDKYTSKALLKIWNKYNDENNKYRKFRNSYFQFFDNIFLILLKHVKLGQNA